MLPLVGLALLRWEVKVAETGALAHMSRYQLLVLLFVLIRLAGLAWHRRVAEELLRYRRVEQVLRLLVQAFRRLSSQGEGLSCGQPRIPSHLLPLLVVEVAGNVHSEAVRDLSTVVHFDGVSARILDQILLVRIQVGPDALSRLDLEHISVFLAIVFLFLLGGLGTFLLNRGRCLHYYSSLYI